MKKVRPGQLVRSASRRGKTPSRFQFDITVDHATGVRNGASYFVKWARGVKVASTKTVTAAKEHSRKGLPFQQKLSLLVTLYRDDPKKAFDEKDSKLYLMQVNPKKQERTVAKVHFNLAQFAGVPSASTTKSFKLSEKVSIKTTIESRFVKSGKSGPGSAGASSALSGITGVSDRSSEPEDDFDDLNIDDVPEPELPAKPSKKSSTRQSSGALPTSAVTSAAPSETSSSSKSSTASAETRSELEKLRAQNEKLGVELRRSQDKRKRMESAHQGELINLKQRYSKEVATESDELLRKMTQRAKDLQKENDEMREKLDAVSKEREELSRKAADADKLQSKNRDLSAQLDRATAAAAASSWENGDGGAAAAAMEERLATTRKEKEVLETKLKAHKAHADKVRDTYQKLSTMYTAVREENIQMQQDLEAARAAAEAASAAAKDGDSRSAGGAAAAAKIAALEAQLAPLQSQVRASNARAQDADAERAQASADLSRTTAQVAALQLKVDRVGQDLQKARTEEDKLREEAAELKGQRDAALKRALSKRGSSGAGEPPMDSGLAAAVAAVRAETAAKIEKVTRDLARERERVAELEEEARGLADDLEYEKGEKMRAREERDALRESARAMERRTSEAARAKDSMQTLQRKISTHVMREEDLQAMVRQLQEEVSRLEEEVEEARAAGQKDDGSEILNVLVKTKLELAQAEDEKLELMFAMKTLKKSERAIQERLAAHASSLEVKLGEASETIEELQRKASGGPSPSRRRSAIEY